MTCVAAFLRDDKIYMGVDSMGSSGDSKTTRADMKMFHRNKMLIGYTASYRKGQLLKYHLKVPIHKKGVDDHRYMCTSFVDSVKKCFKDNDQLSIDSGIASGSYFIVAYRGVIYTIQSDFQVAMNSLPFDTCGSGANNADGALYALYTSSETPVDIVLTSLRAAVVFTNSVGPPFHIWSINKSGKLKKEFIGD